jgi:serine/threonine-protein kinase
MRAACYDAAVPPSGGIPFGNYTLVRRLARGGMAEVFVARQMAQGGVDGWGRAVAVKRILPHLADSPEFTRMFLAEAKLAARLSHPNIVHIYDVGRVEDDYFIAMELVDGVHGAQLVQHAERLPPVLLARVGADAAAALHHAHAQEARVVHRDVSPANLMVSFDGVVKLVDFGIAKALGAGEQTRPGVVKGKYAYMSPEQAMGRALDGKSDVFSLGLVLWELAAGRYAFERGDPAAVMRAIRDGRVPSIEKAAPGLPAPIAETIRAMLAVDVEERPTAAEVGAALEAYIKSSPELATSRELAAWLGPRFPRNPTAELPAIAGTQVAGTAAVSVTSAPVAVSETREQTTIDLHTHALGTDAAMTALVRPSSEPPPVRVRARRPWIAIGVVAVALGAAAAIVGMKATEGTATAPASAAASGSGTGSASASGTAPASGTASAPVVVAVADAAVAAAPDAAMAEPASLTIRTTPPAAVAIVAGQRLETPATFEDLKPGAISLHVEAPGSLPVDRDVALAPGEHRTLELHLVRKADIAINREPAAPKTGTLSARTTPYSEVYEGAKHLGQTPFADVRLPAGAHTLTFKNPGKKPVVKKIVIRAGQTTKLAFDLP